MLPTGAIPGPVDACHLLYQVEAGDANEVKERPIDRGRCRRVGCEEAVMESERWDYIAELLFPYN